MTKKETVKRMKQNEFLPIKKTKNTKMKKQPVKGKEKKTAIVPNEEVKMKKKEIASTNKRKNKLSSNRKKKDNQKEVVLLDAARPETRTTTNSPKPKLTKNKRKSSPHPMYKDKHVSKKHRETTLLKHDLLNSRMSKDIHSTATFNNTKIASKRNEMNDYPDLLEIYGLKGLLNDIDHVDYDHGDYNDVNNNPFDLHEERFRARPRTQITIENRPIVLNDKNIGHYHRKREERPGFLVDTQAFEVTDRHPLHGINHYDKNLVKHTGLMKLF